MLDLDYAEDFVAQVDMNVVMTGSGDLVEIQGTAEEGAFSREQLSEMLDLAWKGIQEIHSFQRLHLLEDRGR
jgi:ribonuclease PH